MTFDLDWLDLREPADRAARDPVLLASAKAHLATFDRPSIVDLGAGSGATMRAFGTLPAAHWRLVDRDAVLLEEAVRRAGAPIETQLLDLRDVDRLSLAGANFVAASALFDLVGRDWIDRLAQAMASAGVGLYAALSYDGSLEWGPDDRDDERVRAAFNRHQTMDKGFGPALGPQGSAHLALAMRREGYDVRIAPSPWRLGADRQALVARLLAGIADAALEAGEAAAPAWLQRRLSVLPAIDCRVGHVDLLALPGAVAMSQSNTMSVPRP